MPCCLHTLSWIAADPASVPVCVVAAAPPARDLPAFSTMTRFPASTASRMAPSRARPSLKPST